MISFGIFIFQIRTPATQVNYFKGIPKYILILCVISIVYTFSNFLINLVNLLEGVPEMINGSYYLNQHGAFTEM